MIFLDDSSFLKWSVRCLFFGRPGRRPLSSGHVPRGSRSCICAHVNFYDPARDRISRLRARLYKQSFLVGPGFEPLALHAIFFVGPGFDSMALQHDLFVGPGFDSRTQSPVSGL